MDFQDNYLIALKMHDLLSATGDGFDGTRTQQEDAASLDRQHVQTR
jgi:hypothetical protein